MLDKPQSQSVGAGGTAIQATGSVTIGLSYSEAREVALDVFRANFYQLAGIAAETATARAKEVTDDFLKKLEAENPGGLAKANEPDFQYALLTAQREYARCGDKELESLLVDLLVDRSKQEERNILQIVLNESLATAPKLTSGQIAALALVFLFKYTQNSSTGNHSLFGDYLDKHAAPFIQKASASAASYQHLEFAGCGAVSMMVRNLESIIGETYHGLFQKGFEAAEIGARGISIGVDQRFFITCFNDSTKLQVRANSKEILLKNFDALHINESDRTKITQLFESNKMTEEEIRQKCIAIRPYMKDLFELWTKSPMQQFTLTSVGMAIGHANVQRLVGKFADLSIWVN